MSGRLYGILGAVGAALLIVVALVRTSPDSPSPAGRRNLPPSSPPEGLSANPGDRRSSPRPDGDVGMPALRRLLESEPETFLERVDENPSWHEAAYRRLFPHPGEIRPEERQALLDSLWVMALSGRRAAAALIGRFELREPLRGQVMGFLRSTGDADLAATIVEGLRECPPNLKSGGPELADSITHHLARRPHPQLLGALADLAGLCADTLPSEGMLKLFAEHLDPRVPEEFRLHAVSGMAAWPEAGIPPLLARCPTEPSPAVRMAILRFAPRRPEGRDALMRALRDDADPNVRRYAAESMRLTGDRATVPALERLAAGEKDRDVARALRDSIRVLEEKR